MDPEKSQGGLKVKEEGRRGESNRDVTAEEVRVTQCEK